MDKEPIFRLRGLRKRAGFLRILFLAGIFLLVIVSTGVADTCRVWEKVDITLQAEKPYRNPCTVFRR